MFFFFIYFNSKVKYATDGVLVTKNATKAQNFHCVNQM